MDRKELIRKYIEFFKTRNHKEIPNSSLIPENDPTVLFTTAGMHPLVPYLLGQPHPLGKRLCNVQKCIRTQDIEDVGNATHHTFFEMLGNWSIGDYFKKEAISLSFEFLTKELKIPVERLAITCFAGDENAPKDNESSLIWQSLGIPKKRIAFLPKEDNWWGPAGKTGPCGPDTEMFYWNSKEAPPEVFNPNDKNWVELWNDVLMQYNKDKRLILVDGMYCLYDENFNLNKELLDLINSFNSHYVLTVNGFREKGRSLVKNYDLTQDTNWEAFSLEEEEIKKDNPEYFKRLLKAFNLIPEEIIYFDHNKKNVDTAKSLGILSLHYSDNKSVKKFIEDNLYCIISAKQKNIDTGMGMERTISILSGYEDNYLSDAFLPLIKEIEKISKKKYNESNETTRAMRIIADHLKASTLILSEKVQPSNKEHGYVLRRLIRRAIIYGKTLNMQNNFTKTISEIVFQIYDDYPLLKQNKDFILSEIEKEEARFRQTLASGLNFFERVSRNKTQISGKDAFLLHQSYGFPIEMTTELAKKKSIKINMIEFEEESKAHQELSRTASSGMFKSGLADNSEATTKLHTACHLLNESLRIILNKKEIFQKGSNITPERLRFDFTFDRKLTNDEIKKIEELVNKKIQEKIPVKKEEMTVEEAKKIGAQGVFDSKYKEKVFVYSIGNFSKEICAGPHVKNTSELGKFRIIKEEASSAGVRRIKAVLE